MVKAQVILSNYFGALTKPWPNLLDHYKAGDKGKVLWNKERNAVAFCLNEEKSRCYVIVGETTIDVSQVEHTNIGKLGIAKKDEYEKVKTVPEVWLAEESGVLIVSFKTEAWHSGQKYTAKEPVAIKNGKYIQR